MHRIAPFEDWSCQMLSIVLISLKICHQQFIYSNHWIMAILRIASDAFGAALAQVLGTGGTGSLLTHEDDAVARSGELIFVMLRLKPRIFPVKRHSIHGAGTSLSDSSSVSV